MSEERRGQGTMGKKGGVNRPCWEDISEKELSESMMVEVNGWIMWEWEMEPGVPSKFHICVLPSSSLSPTPHRIELS